MPNFTLPITLAEQAPAVDIYNGTAFAAQVTLSQPLTDFERMSFLFDDGGEAEITVAALRQCGLSLSGNNITVIDDTTLAVAQQPGSSAVLAVVKGVGEAPAVRKNPAAITLWEGKTINAGDYNITGGEFADFDLLEFYFVWEGGNNELSQTESPICISRQSFVAGRSVEHWLERTGLAMQISYVSPTVFRRSNPSFYGGTVIAVPYLVGVIGVRF